jgi:predicted component of type VI protein secretion system
MIVCPNCNHQNPEGATQCEACYTPLPATTSCPNCGATVQTDAAFCGQCGHNLQQESAGTEGTAAEAAEVPPTAVSAPVAAPESGAGVSVPDLEAPEPLVEAEPIAMTSEAEAQAPEAVPTPAPTPTPAPASSATQLQQPQTARLLHVQTNTVMELPSQLSVIHIGKPNDMIPPDIDVSGFPNSEIVSRVHADIRTEGDAFYIEDVGSSNGTYINNLPLPKGNRHRLRAGDRISLGKGDLVSLIFQLS